MSGKVSRDPSARKPVAKATAGRRIEVSVSSGVARCGACGGELRTHDLRALLAFRAEHACAPTGNGGAPCR